MASSTSRIAALDENMENRAAAGKLENSRIVRPDAATPHKRSVLGDLTPNKALSSRPQGMDAKGLPQQQQQQQRKPASPLKRAYRDPLGEGGRGFTYLKRRRLSHGHAVGDASLFRQEKNQARPLQEAVGVKLLSPPSSGRNITGSSKAVQHSKAQGTISPPEKESDEDSGRESQNSNATRGSFSSLINYDPSSQQALASQALNYVNIPPSVAAHTSQTPSSTRHATNATSSVAGTIRAHAEMLRLRLKVAVYKVRTNQINVPFSRLRAPDPLLAPAPAPARHAQSPILNAIPSPRISSPDPHHDHNDHDHDHDDEEDDEDDLPTARRLLPSHNSHTQTQHQNHPYGLGLGLGLHPAPDTTPNAYSNRFMPLHRAPSSSPPFIHVPSSLPRTVNMSKNGAALMTRRSHDHESLDSEATELAEDDMGDEFEEDGRGDAGLGRGVLESPSQMPRRGMVRVGMGMGGGGGGGGGKGVGHGHRLGR